MLHSAQIAYVIKHVQAHSTECVCWKLRDVRLPLPYSPGRKSSNSVPFFFQSHFHTQPNTSQLCQMCFPSQVKWMEGVTRQPALQDAGSWEQEPSWENEYPSVGRRKWAKQKIPSQPNHHAELFWFMLLAAFLSAQWHTLKIFAVWTRFHV